MDASDVWCEDVSCDWYLFWGNKKVCGMTSFIRRPVYNMTFHRLIEQKIILPRCLPQDIELLKKVKLTNTYFKLSEAKRWIIVTFRYPLCDIVPSSFIDVDSHFYSLLTIPHLARLIRLLLPWIYRVCWDSFRACS